MSEMSREEWNKAYAARIVERTGMSMQDALELAEMDVTSHTEGEAPTDAADTEMSYWDDDGDGVE